MSRLFSLYALACGVAAVCLLGPVGAVRAQQPLHDWLGRAEGLPDGFVLSITEDRAGHIWFGTKDGGAVRYDGMHMRTYTVHDGLPYNDVRTVFEDRDGRLWFATHGGGIFYTSKDGYYNQVDEQSGTKLFPVCFEKLLEEIGGCCRCAEAAAGGVFPDVERSCQAV